MEANPRLCLGCSKPLRGRQDKKFCDDYCRNNYNNRQNSDQNNYVRNINNILRKNRRILASVLTGTEETVKVRKDKLSQEGFHFGYFTHQYLTMKGQTYHFCYEFGYLSLENDWILVVKRKAE